MKTLTKLSTVLALVTLVGLFPGAASAQVAYDDDSITFAQRNLGGPRLGVTFVPGNTDLYHDLQDKDMDRLISQFGWHFEYQVIPEGGGPQFVVQFVPMVGGVEYGKVIPTGTLAMGVRFPNGIEFGLGPNVMIVGGDDIAKTSLILALGKSFDYGGVSIPLNLVFAKSPEGNRISIIFGYAIRKTR